MSQSKVNIFLSVLFISILIVSIPLTIIPYLPHRYKEFIYSDFKSMTLAYFGPKTPVGFYNDRLERSRKIHDSIYYHRKFNGEFWEFFSAADYNEAKALVKYNLNNSNVKVKKISETFECEKYFEFKTVENHENGNTYILRHRIHKTSYIQLTDAYIFPAWWLGLNDERLIELGTFNHRPINLWNSKNLIEYLWFIQHYNLFGIAIYDEILKQDYETIYCIFLEVHLNSGDWDIPDVIEMIYSKFSINKNSGKILLYQHVFREFSTGR
jgi:hypothetical protein